MGPYRETHPSADPGLPALVTLDPRRLSDRTLGRLRDGLAAPLAGRVGGRRSVNRLAVLLILAYLAARIAIALAEEGYGTVRHGAGAGQASLVYGLLGAVIVQALLYPAAWLRGPALRGCVLVPGGLIRSGPRGLAFAPADRIGRVDVRGTRSCRVRLEGDRRTQRVRGVVVPDTAAAILERADEIRRARARGDDRALDRLELVPPAELAAARRRPGLWLPAPGLAALLAGTLVASLCYGWYLPARSLAVMEPWDEGHLPAWRAIAAQHPLPWITARVDRRIAALRAALLQRLAPRHQVAFGRFLDFLCAADEDDAGVYVELPRGVFPAGTATAQADVIAANLNAALGDTTIRFHGMWSAVPSLVLRATPTDDGRLSVAVTLTGVDRPLGAFVVSGPLAMWDPLREELLAGVKARLLP